MKGYDKLGSNGQVIFNRTHTRHLASMGTEQREHYERDQIKEVVANNSEQVIEVYFKNGEFFKYTTYLTWH